VAGRHRLEAFKLLGRSEIPAHVTQFDEGEAKLATLYENLCRTNMTKLEQVNGLKECKRIYQTIHPESKRGVAGAMARHNPATAVSSFARDYAEKTGMSVRDVNRKISIGERLHDQVKEAIQDTATANNLSELENLLRCDFDTQLKIAEHIKGGKAKSVAEAERLISKVHFWDTPAGKFRKAIGRARSALLLDNKSKESLLRQEEILRESYREELLVLRKQVDELIEMLSSPKQQQVTNSEDA